MMISLRLEKLETNMIATVDSDFEVYRYRNRYHFNNVFFDYL
jgi:hypothetical protein